MQPARLGGAELDYVALIDLAAEVARGDATVGWNLGNLGSHHWMLAMFPAAAQDAVWSRDPDALIASSFVFPAGRAKRVPGGYSISGRWPFSSGVDACAWNMLAGIVAPAVAGEPSENRIFLVPKSAYRSLDNWDSMGLRGTGSHDVEGTDIFVAEDMTLAVADIAGGPTPGHERNPGALYRIPVFALFPFVLSGTALGNAQAALDDYVDSARTRASRYSGSGLAGFQSVQIAIARAGAKIDTARRIMRGICIDAMRDAEAGRVPTLAEKVTYRRDGAFAVNLCTEAVGDLFAVSGASGLYKSGAAERRFRDAHAIASHIAFSFDAAGANFGRVALGFPSDNPTL
jgi:3-hydroxy-9,10-secoandrosta-1,3,5(10)-triene-9,17-dione monooxygenase